MGKIAVTSTGPELTSAMDSRFGRCSWFIIIDPDSMDFESLENDAGSLGGGAGIQTAQMLAHKGVSAVLTGNCGPNAHQTLSAAGIAVHVGMSGSVEEAVSVFKAGGLKAASGPNVESHSGMKK